MNRRTMLKGGLVLAATAHTAALAPIIADPLLDAIMSYQAGLLDFRENSPDDDEDADAYAERSYGPHLNRLNDWDGPAVTRGGAIEALRISLTEVDGVYGSEAADRMVKAALGYLESLPA